MAKFSKGDKVKIVGNKTRHNRKNGEIFTIKDIEQLIDNQSLYNYSYTVNENHYNYYECDLELYTEQPNTKVCIKSDGTKEYGRKIIDYLVSLGGKDPNHWEGNNLDNPYYFIKENGRIANDNQIPEGYTEISLKEPESSPKDKAIEWLESNGYVKSDKYLPCKECAISSHNNSSNKICDDFLNLPSGHSPCRHNDITKACGWIKKEEPKWMYIGGIDLSKDITPQIGIIMNVKPYQVMITHDPQKEEITIFEKPKNKRKLIQVSI